VLTGEFDPPSFLRAQRQRLQSAALIEQAHDQGIDADEVRGANG
jgi:hypothetical protein